MSYLVLLFVAILPVFLILLYIYHKDREKEPISLLIKLFLSGILSGIIVIIISMILEPTFPILFTNKDNLNLIEAFLQAFFGVALLEEGCKWLMVYNISYNNKEFDDLYDMIVYCVFTSLGFAMFENIYYVLDGGLGTGITRALLAVPSHACNGVFMGCYLGLSKLAHINNRKDLHDKYIIYSIVTPIILHGIYDYCLLSGSLILFFLFFIFIIVLYNKTHKRINRFAAVTKKLQSKDEYCPNCGQVIDGNFCSNCGRKND